MMDNKLRNTSSNIAETVIVVLILLLISYLLGSKFFHRFDLTENKMFTISQSTRDVLGEMDDPVNVEFFLTSDLPSQFVTTKNDVMDRLEEYVAFSNGNFKLKTTDPGNNEEEIERAMQLGIRELEVQVTSKDQMSVKKIFFGLVMSYEDRTETIRTDELINPTGLEYSLTTRLVRLTQEKKPKIGLFSGNLNMGQQQQQPQGPTYEGIKQILGGAEGLYEVVTIDPQANQILPDDLDGLIIAGAFGMSDTLKYSVDQFLLNGGQVLVGIDPMMNPGQQGQPNQAYPSLPSIEDQLEKYGVKFNKQLIVDETCAQAPMGGGLFTIIRDYLLWPEIGPSGFNKDISSVAQLESLVMPWTCPLTEVEISGVTFTPLAKCSDKSFTISSPFDLSPDQDWAFLSTTSETKGPYNLAVMIEGDIPTAFPDGPPSVKEPGSDEPVTTTPQFIAEDQVKLGNGEGRLIVMSTAVGISDNFLRQFNQNALYLANITDMMLMGDQLLGIRSTPVTKRPIKQLEDTQRSLIKWLNILGVPVLLVIFGFILFFMRKQRRKSISEYYHGTEK